MQRFTQLFDELDSTTRTGEKLDAMRRYFAQAPPRDAAWALALLAGGKLIRSISSRRLRDWVCEETGYPEWLVNESYDAVGDLSETLALLLQDGPAGTSRPLHWLIEERLLPLPAMSEDEQRATVKQTWRDLSGRQRFLYHKMIMGELRVGVSARLVYRALAEVAGVEPAVIAHRLSGHWSPGEQAFRDLMQPDDGGSDPAGPYPFYLAHPIELAPVKSVEGLGPVEDWQAEWKWDGIRAQLLHRVGPASSRSDRQDAGPTTATTDRQDAGPTRVMIWSRGDELITQGFPEIAAVAADLPVGTVLDGEILAWEGDRPLPFAMLQRRINRKREAPRLWDEVPVVFMAFDVLEHHGHDVRSLPLSARRRLLEEIGRRFENSRHFRLSPLVAFSSWEELRERQGEARERGAEGLMLKRLSSPYGVGRPRGDWWKWKVDPYTVDAVLIYAQLGNGKRANIFTDYTFGLWDRGELVPIAKAYSGLTDDEIREVDSFVRRNTLDRHGPVRVVKPELVFELAFENIQASTRHKSGLAVRFPRMARWRRDKPPQEADTIETLRGLLHERRSR